MAILIKPLSNLDIKNATEGELLRDGEGLILQVTKKNKVWRLDYKKPITKARTSITLGYYPNLSLRQAREKKNELKELIRQGIDPQEHKRKIERKILDNLEKTFYKVALQWKVFKSSKVTKETMEEDWRRLELHIFPTLADIQVERITSKLLVDTLQIVYRKGHTSVIEKVLRSVEGIMDHAENCGLIEMHNCHKAKKAFHYKPAENNPTIPIEELPTFITKMMFANIEPYTQHLIFWNLLTGVRPSEAVAVEWREIDWENRLWRIPKEKMKGSRYKKREHIVPLSKQSLDILQRMKAFSRHSRFVFPHFKGGDRPMCSETVNRAMKRNGYKGIFTSHGMRALISTHLNEQNFNPDAIEMVLAHKIKGSSVRRVYNRHDYLKERIEIMDYWGNYLEQQGLRWKPLV
ncbi:tyrosine-type recombinase/integrase [Glaesserella parasuis]|uniref:Integrase n=1 Tax=Glaesserella parasuis HPS10 TaxID=1450514 RepID=A0A836Z0Z7_GLAPU|nr:tyrosine-type recombinase/integrase [Glaesserella parasuis]KDB46222.1 integrase [Glaesserella parasuis HPS10]MCT8540818.1 tyrosine-type recombinase/integrase [Glaesserella parasuis]MCT8542819.1 tyrosine-type recombinase/integrase [Glaesserella parasuis]MCT8563616.1 tyrosine-type recombinase/integrase [Glaesserella parasuis]MCT8590569.1 tyrosine-type recombinase/integrase [Glaesserella parasuis]